MIYNRCNKQADVRAQIGPFLQKRGYAEPCETPVMELYYKNSQRQRNR